MTSVRYESSPEGVSPQAIEAEVGGLRRYARTLTGNDGRADDLVQDTVVRALERRASFHGRSSLATWLHSIMHNLAVDAARRAKELPVDMDDLDGQRVETLWSDEAYSVDSSIVVERAEARMSLQDALLRIPLIYRAAVVLHDGEGLTSGEVAEVQEISLAAAKQRLRRGRMMLVSALAEGDRVHESDVPLRCWDARQLVSDYMDDDLDTRRRGLLEDHLKRCPTCPPLYAGLVGVRAALSARRDPDDAVPATVAERIRSLGTS